MGASKTTKSMKILVLENFRLYGICALNPWRFVCFCENGRQREPSTYVDTSISKLNFNWRVDQGLNSLKSRDKEPQQMNQIGVFHTNKLSILLALFH